MASDGLRIAIDGMNLALPRGTGVATYARNLGRCIRRGGHGLSVLYGLDIPAGGDAMQTEIAFFDVAARTPRKRSALAAVARVLGDVGAARAARVPRTGHVRRETAELRPPPDAALYNVPDMFRRAREKFSVGLGFLEVTLPEPVDVVHWTYPVPVRARGARNLYTLHDLVPLRLPYATLDSKPFYRRLVDAVVRQADAIVTVSDQSREDIVTLLGADPARVVNTGQSVALPEAALAKSEADIDVELSRLFVALESEHAGGRMRPETLRRDGFFLFLGAIEPKKNLRRAMEAYLAAGVPEPLVVVGRFAWQCEAEKAMIRRAPQIVYFDYLDAEQAITLLRAARALVFPSLYEGFGLPVLEAFQCGTPVIAAGAGGLEEVAGDAALTIDPGDVAAIRDAIRALSGPEAEPRRAEMAARGCARARLFDEATVAARIDALYRRVVAGR